SNSLPEPFSPSINTLASVGAQRFTLRSSSRMAAFSPIKQGDDFGELNLLESYLPDCFCCCWPAARLRASEKTPSTVLINFSLLQGLITKSAAPALIAF